jgi:hypothetical protein
MLTKAIRRRTSISTLHHPGILSRNTKTLLSTRDFQSLFSCALKLYASLASCCSHSCQPRRRKCSICLASMRTRGCSHMPHSAQIILMGRASANWARVERQLCSRPSLMMDSRWKVLHFPILSKGFMEANLFSLYCLAFSPPWLEGAV